MTRDWISIAAVGTLTVIWGSAFALTGVALEGFSPAAIAAGRTWLSAGAVLCLTWALGQSLPRRWDHWAWCAGLGALSLAIPFFLLAWAQQTVPSAVAAIFISCVPLFVLLLSRLILGEAVSPLRWLGFVVGLAGILWLIGPAALPGLLEGGGWPQLALLGAALCYGSSAILIRVMPPIPPVEATAAAQIAASVLLLPVGIAAWPGVWPMGAPLIALAVLGLVQTGVAQLLRYYTVRRAGPVFVSVVGYLIPIWAGILGVVLLSEPLTWRMISAFAIILVGLVLAQRRGPA
ncbi:MAG: DMT family transporter [Pseudomonadota bacterium]